VAKALLSCHVCALSVPTLCSNSQGRRPAAHDTARTLVKVNCTPLSDVIQYRMTTDDRKYPFSSRGF
jgi:hypothetical protein